MLTNIINKNKFTATLAGLVLLAASSGCSWKPCGSFLIHEKLPAKIVKKGEETHKKYKLSKLENNNLSIEFLVLEDKILYEIYEKVSISKETEYKVYYNPTPAYIVDTVTGGVLIACDPTPGKLIGIAISLWYCASAIRHETSENGILSKAKRKEFCKYMKELYPQLKAQKSFGEDLGYALRVNIKSVESGSEEKIDSVSSSFAEEKEVLYKDEKAQYIKVRIHPEDIFKNSSAETDENGIATFFIKLPYNEAFSEEDLEQKIRSLETVKELEEQTRKALLPQILENIEKKDYEISVETVMQNTEDAEITNGSIKFIMKAYYIPKEKISAYKSVNNAKK